MKKAVLEAYGQLHLLNHYNTLKEDEKKDFKKQVDSIDFKHINTLYHTLVTKREQHSLNGDILPIKPVLKTPESATHYMQIGLDAIKKGRVAVLLLAGGQGSRLGHDGPKGTYDIGVKDAGSLFEIHAKNLITLAAKTQVYLPWYIMTSEVNHDATLDFFERNLYFGYPKHKVTFFKQGMIEAVDHNGKIIIQSPTTISKSPDGNGGCFKAMKDCAIVDKLVKEGNEWLFIFNVDNAITNIADPVFIGFTIESKQPCSAKVVPKVSPDEKVGVPCTVGGKPTIVEYSELTSEQVNERDSEGMLIYKGGNIGNYCLRIDILNAYLQNPLSYHLAHKKIAYLDDEGKTITPKEANGYKFELFIFDIFPAFSGMSVLEVSREEEFAPVKNAKGSDSPQTAKALYEAKYNKRKGDICEE